MLIAFLLAVAAPVTSVVKVLPAVPNPAWVANGVLLQPDQACQNVTLNTLEENSSCGEAVARFEPGAVVPVAVRTIATTKRTQDAIQLLETSLEHNNHPVLHASLGFLLSSAEFVPPDYPKALHHLRIASDAGNPSATNQLAKLLYEGKGTERDLSQAVKMSAKAAGLGYPRAATDLARLYHIGLLLPRDEQLSKAWLDAGIAVGEPTATKLASAIASENKVHVMQLMPSADPAKVRMIRYSPLTKPEVRAEYGFDNDFEAVYKKPYSDAATLAWLETEAKRLPTPYLFELARRQAGTDPSKAQRTLFLAQLQMSYDALRCADSEAAREATIAWTQFTLTDARYMMRQLPSPGFIEDVLATDTEFPADNEPWWVCRAGTAAMLTSVITAESPDIANPLRLKPKSEWTNIRKKLIKSVRDSSEKFNTVEPNNR